MKMPITVYSTNSESGNIYYYEPDEELFYEKINDSLMGKIHKDLECLN